MGSRYLQYYPCPISSCNGIVEEYSAPTCLIFVAICGKCGWRDPREYIENSDGSIELVAHIPKAICVRCNREMEPFKNGVLVEMTIESGPYYRTYADKWGCSMCGNEIVLGFANEVVEQWQENDLIWQLNPDIKATFR